VANILIIGDSQAGNPGAAAKAALVALGHTVTQIHNDGDSPVTYVNTPSLWNQYTSLAAQNDLVLLIFGHNSPAGTATSNALVQMRDSVHAPVYMSGPPQYPPDASPTSSGQPSQQVGDALRTQNQAIFGANYIDAYPSTPTSLPRDSLGWHLTPTSAQGWGQAMATVMDQAARGGAGMGVAIAIGATAVGALALVLVAVVRRRRARA